MTHSDEKGLVLPPKIAPTQVVIIPICKKDSQENREILAQVHQLQSQLEAAHIRVQVDSSDTHSPGWKFAEYELQGIPIRLAIGARDLERQTVEIARRDTQHKFSIPKDSIVSTIQNMLNNIQESMFTQAENFQKTHTTQVDNYDDFKKVLQSNIPGFIEAHWDGTTATEQKIQQETQATIRCLLPNGAGEQGTCIYSGKPSSQRVLFAKAY